MKLDRFVISCGLLAGLVASGVAQDPASPPQSKLVIDRVNPGSPARTLHFSKAVAPPRLIGEGGGTCLLHYCDVNPVSVKPSFFHLLVVAGADGRQFAIYHDECRSPEPLARVNERGDVATVLRWSCVKAFFAPDYKPVNIRKLRSDRFLKAAPKFERFTIRDISWGEGILVCIGHLTISGGEYPFLSRLLFNDKREVSDHQILWTTWKPGPSSGVQRNPAANSIAKTLLQQGGLVLWKNAGPCQQTNTRELPPGFEKSGWQCTELATGATRPLAETDPVNRDRLQQIESEIEKTRIRRELRP